MNAIPSDLTLPEDVVGSAAKAAGTKLPFRATVYFFIVGTAAAAVGIPLIIRLSSGTSGWPTFFLLATCAAVAQLFVVRPPRDQSYHTTNVFLIPAALLLPPELVALMGVALIPEWLKVRYPWYIQSFNICNHTLNGLAAWWVADLIGEL